MIIRYPTGLYAAILPKGNERGNVTFTISNNAPPRSDLSFIKIPVAIVKRRRVKPTISEYERRQSLGDLIYTVSQSNKTDEGNSNRQFELGQTFEFESFTGKELDPMLVSMRSETRHDTNRIDYAALGLSASDQDAMASASFAAQADITNQLNYARQQRVNAEETINVQQKIINDVTKTIDGLTITLNSSAVTGSLGTEADVIETIIAKLTIKRNAAFAARDAAIKEANDLAAQALALSNQLQAIGYMVK